MQVRFLMRNTTPPLNPLSNVGSGLQTTRKRGFLPLLHVGEGGRGDEVKSIYTPYLFTNKHYRVHRYGATLSDCYNKR